MRRDAGGLYPSKRHCGISTPPPAELIVVRIDDCGDVRDGGELETESLESTAALDLLASLAAARAWEIRLTNAARSEHAVGPAVGPAVGHAAGHAAGHATGCAEPESEPAAACTQHAAELAAVRAEYEAELADVRSEHVAELAVVRSEHEAELAVVRAEYDVELAAVRAEHVAERGVERGADTRALTVPQLEAFRLSTSVVSRRGAVVLLAYRPDPAQAAVQAVEISLDGDNPSSLEDLAAFCGLLGAELHPVLARRRPAPPVPAPATLTELTSNTTGQCGALIQLQWSLATGSPLSPTTAVDAHAQRRVLAARAAADVVTSIAQPQVVQATQGYLGGLLHGSSTLIHIRDKFARLTVATSRAASEESLKLVFGRRVGEACRGVPSRQRRVHSQIDTILSRTFPVSDMDVGECSEKPRISVSFVVSGLKVGEFLKSLVSRSCGTRRGSLGT